MLDKIPLNFELMKEPANWFIVTLMFAIIALGLAMIFHVQPAGPKLTGN
jgi:hypothetical protein